MAMVPLHPLRSLRSLLALAMTRTSTMSALSMAITCRSSSCHAVSLDPVMPQAVLLISI